MHLSVSVRDTSQAMSHCCSTLRLRDRSGARADGHTTCPDGFDPVAAGVIFFREHFDLLTEVPVAFPTDSSEAPQEVSAGSFSAGGSPSGILNRPNLWMNSVGCWPFWQGFGRLVSVAGMQVNYYG